MLSERFGLSASWEPLGGSPEPPQVKTRDRGFEGKPPSGSQAKMSSMLSPPHSGIWEDSILLVIGQPASYDAGIREKPLGGFPPNPLSLVLT